MSKGNEPGGKIPPGGITQGEAHEPAERQLGGQQPTVDNFLAAGQTERVENLPHGIDSVATLVEVLRRNQLLEPDQLEALCRKLRPPLPEPRAVAKGAD